MGNVKHVLEFTPAQKKIYDEAVMLFKKMAEELDTSGSSNLFHPYLLDEQFDHIYFIKTIPIKDDREFVKIGRAGSVKRRLGELQTANPFALDVIYYFACPKELSSSIESILHTIFQKHNTVGEWFLYCDDIKVWIEEHSSEYNDVVISYPKIEKGIGPSDTFRKR